MNKILKYILIGTAVLLGIMLVSMFFMRPGDFDVMYNEINNTNNQVSSTPIESQVNKNVTYKNITTKKLAIMLQNKDFVLVNVHIPYIGDIKGTDVSIPFDTIDQNLDKLPKDKTAKIVVYCQSGNMSVEAANTLSRLGYSNVYNVVGGMIQWQKDGNSLIKS